MIEELPKRKRNRLLWHDYCTPGMAYFITVCTKDRKKLFWREKQPSLVGEDRILPQLSKQGKIAQEAIEAIPKHYPMMELVQYVIMPNHIHMILRISYEGGQMRSAPTISSVVGQTKRRISKQVGASVWQRSFHDHVIRGREDYLKIAKYIEQNPFIWELDCFYVGNK